MNTVYEVELRQEGRYYGIKYQFPSKQALEAFIEAAASGCPDEETVITSTITVTQKPEETQERPVEPF